MVLETKTKAYLAWAAICIIWGTTYLAIRVGVEDLPPLFFAGFRWFLAGPILFLFLMKKNYRLPEWNDIKHSTVVGILLLGFGNGFVVFSEQWIPSGLAALLITTVPFWIVGIESFYVKGANLNLQTVIGLLSGMVGVMLIFGSNIISIFDSHYLKGVAGLFVAVTCWSFGTIYSKYNTTKVHPLMSAALQMTIAGTLMTLVSIIIGEHRHLSFTTESTLAFIYLLIIGSLIGYGSYIYAIEHLPVSFVSTYAYINPIIAIFLGWLILDEAFNLVLLLSAAIILTGVYLVKKGSVELRMKLSRTEK
ncbi:EamA family transporter [Melioribacter sp. OK-6-Me]|uniref:EamA family transporter n=1 Tax=unclassified Melioribacter TaxID=2627329 RepID=UPI003ED8CD09